MRRGRGRRPLGGALWATLLVALAVGGFLSAARAAAAEPLITIRTADLAAPAFMGLGVQWDPYDFFRPTQADWNLTVQRLDFMRPGFVRVVEPASDYFAGYDAAHNPAYRWSAPRVLQLRAILDYTRSRGISVVIGDWANPLIFGDVRVPAGFLAQLHDRYGYTNIKYYNLINEPNNFDASCDFGCWAGTVTTLSTGFNTLGLTRWLKLVGPDNQNSWDDTRRAQALDTTSGLDSDNPIGGDSWVTRTLHAIPARIGAYDSHRYGTIWGIENGVYQDQMRARREQISNRDSPGKNYFAAEVGMTARQVSPFSLLADGHAARQLLSQLIDPSATASVSPFIDSQPHIREFAYGVWMGDMMIQGIAAGLSGASAWDLDDAMHVGGQYGSRNLKQWGFWNSLGGKLGYPASDRQLRPWYYPWSVLARSFPAGSQTLTTPSSGVPGLRIAAAKIPSAGGYALSFAVVNDSDTPTSVRLSVPSVIGRATLARYDYFASERPTDAAGLPVPSRILQRVRLAGGVSIQLPSRGLVVLSSVGSGLPVALNDGSRMLVDPLGDWRRVYSRSRDLKLDHGQPAHFNDDRSRATPTANRGGYLVYRVSQITSFELKAYYQRTLGIRVYGSRDGNAWTPISLAATNPAPAVGGGGWYLSESLPHGGLPAGTNLLKIALTNRRTELSQVAIHSRASSSAARAPRR